MSAPVQHEAGSLHAQTAPNSSQVVQIETLGRHGIAVLWISAFIGAAALVTSLAFSFWIDRVSSRVYVLEYDAGRICARLQEKEIVEACH